MYTMGELTLSNEAEKLIHNQFVKSRRSGVSQYVEEGMLVRLCQWPTMIESLPEVWPMTGQSEFIHFSVKNTTILVEFTCSRQGE
jgi:hypothetical protein